VSPGTNPQDALKRAIAAIYSVAAERVYEPIVVKRAFPLFGGDLNRLVIEQGRRAVLHAEGAPILDMPVGTAYFTASMARVHDGLVVGSDIAEGMVRRAARSARENKLFNLVAVQGDAHRLPFAEESFGAILCTNGLQVIPESDLALSELARVLAPEGRMFVSVVTLPVGGFLPQRVADRLPMLLRSRRDLVEAVRRVGLEVISTRTNRLGIALEAHKGPGGVMFQAT
jgi:SAM-dependent methyltransferase